MSEIVTLDVRRWTEAVAAAGTEQLERGDVLYLPNLAFHIEAQELRFFSPGTVTGAKNVSFDPVRGRLGHTSAEGKDRTLLQGMLDRFSRMARALVEGLAPRYGTALATGRTSFRPVEIAGRETSWRKDDTRLHIDAFPATPVHGRRILRVFSNVNPLGRPRAWRVGVDFEPIAARFAPRLRLPLPGTAELQRLLRLTKSRRSAYDALMLQLHDRMKADADFQSRSPSTSFEFPAGTTWLAFTDAVSHAATAGQHQLEQTFLVPIAAMIEPARSPLRVLERITGRPLA
jgi:hypothetical protein